MSLDCVCKGISHVHKEAALATGPKTARDLYATALEIKKADPHAKNTGLEDRNGAGFNCGRCRTIFDDAVKAQAPVAMPIIMMRATSEPPPRSGACGKDCTTCTPQVVEAAGCQPQAV